MTDSPHDDVNACTASTTPLLSRSSPSLGVKATSKAALFQEIVKKAQKLKVEQGFVSILPPDVQEKFRASPNICEAFAEAIKARQVADSLKAQEEMHLLQQELSAKQEETIRLEKKVFDNQEEMKQLQVKALEQLAVLQSRIQAVLTQTYELHEFPIPRLFVVLPQYPSGWDILEPFTDKYRLYFLCERGDHTKKAGSNSNIPHKIHFATHEGYEIARPTEFFQHYGPYILTVLKMLKFGVSVASVAVPTVAHLINADALDQVGKGLQHPND
ncbi:hypothetical protein BGZ67_002956 [Mortierella alpina]|nr:hypothetical protein BGZ67_002956 [Mortierella alpina]